MVYNRFQKHVTVILLALAKRMKSEMSRKHWKTKTFQFDLFPTHKKEFPTLSLMLEDGSLINLLYNKIILSLTYYPDIT